jgi:hypothetical protein
VVEPQSRVRRWGPATSLLVRHLAVSTEPLNQVALAKRFHVSQPRISQIIRLLASHGIETGDLNDPVQRHRLVDLYLRNHRPNVVSETLFYSLDPMYEQVRTVVEVAHEHEVRVAVSADLAPDLISPWRSPSLTVVYLDQNLDMPLVSFVPALARGEASILLRVVSDDSLLDPWSGLRRDIPVVHPVQQVWDLHDLGWEDRNEAANRLIDAVLS